MSGTVSRIAIRAATGRPPALPVSSRGIDGNRFTPLDFVALSAAYTVVFAAFCYLLFGHIA